MSRVFSLTTLPVGIQVGISMFNYHGEVLYADQSSPYDNFSAKQCHQKPLPCSVNNTALCISQADANEVYRLGNYEYAYR